MQLEEDTQAIPTRVQRVARFIVSNMQPMPFFRYLVKPAVLVGPPAAALVFLEHVPLLAQLEPLVGPVLVKHASAIAESSGLIVVIGIYVYRMFVQYVWEKLKSLAGSVKELGRSEILQLLVTLDEIVGSKARRFATASSKRRQKRRTAAEVFDEITKPDQQIALLVSGVHSYFCLLTGMGNGLKVSLLAVANKNKLNWEYVFPEGNPGFRASDLAQAKSTVSLAIRSREMVIVEDVAKEISNGSSSRFLAIEGAPKVGSQLTYPVLDLTSGAVVYAISIYSSRPGSFRLAEHRIYNWALSKFALRILLERSLSQLKQGAGRP